MRTRTIAAAAVAALALTGVGLSTASAGTSRAVGCGATVTGNAHLKGDVKCPAGKGIVLTGNATLDLRGHQLIGPGRNVKDSGIGVEVSQDGTSTVVNGTVRDWSTGIGRTGDEFLQVVNTVRDVRLVRNGVGIDSGRYSIEIRRVLIADGGTGIEGFDGNLAVTDSVFRNNEDGLFTGDSGTTVTRSRFTGNTGTALACWRGGCDIEHNHIAGNAVGIDVGISDSDPNIVSNTFARNTTAIKTGQATQPVVDGNRFVSNRTGILVESEAGLTARRNSFTGNRVGIGMLVTGTEHHVLLTGNTFARNGDGINLPDATGFSIGDTKSVNNKGWGIFAPNATDLGGNKAKGNGNQPQCVGVLC